MLTRSASGQNYPNPFTGETVHGHELQKQSGVGVMIYSVVSQVVKTSTENRFQRASMVADLNGSVTTALITEGPCFRTTGGIGSVRLRNAAGGLIGFAAISSGGNTCDKTCMTPRADIVTFQSFLDREG